MTRTERLMSEVEWEGRLMLGILDDEYVSISARWGSDLLVRILRADSPAREFEWFVTEMQATIVAHMEER